MVKDKMIIWVSVIVVVLIALYLYYHKKSKEGYKHHALEQATGACKFTTSPLDYVFKGPNFQRGNPHFQAKPTTYYAPLELGKVDFYPDLRRLDNNQPLFRQFDTQWAGYGGSYIPNTTDTRDRMIRTGYYAPAEVMAGKAGITAGSDPADLLTIGASPTVKL